MTYAGLTTADKGALMDAKARGAEWAARDESTTLWGYVSKPHKTRVCGDFQTWAIDDFNVVLGAIDIEDDLLQFIQWSDAEPVNIDLALAQIEEMESKPLTWNERINQMTLDERAKCSAVYAQVVERARRYAYRTRRTRAWEIESVMDKYMRKFLAIPYTEGEKK